MVNILENSLNKLFVRSFVRSFFCALIELLFVIANTSNKMVSNFLIPNNSSLFRIQILLIFIARFSESKLYSSIKKRSCPV